MTVPIEHPEYRCERCGFRWESYEAAVECADAHASGPISEERVDEERSAMGARPPGPPVELECPTCLGTGRVGGASDCPGNVSGPQPCPDLHCGVSQ